jgi:hypothetical protein
MFSRDQPNTPFSTAAEITLFIHKLSPAEYKYEIISLHLRVALVFLFRRIARINELKTLLFVGQTHSGLFLSPKARAPAEEV